MRPLEHKDMPWLISVVILALILVAAFGHWFR